MKRKITIAIVESQQLLRVALKSLISVKNEFHVSFEASNGQEFIQKLNKNFPPDLVLMSSEMPIMNGLETTKWIRENCPKLKVIIISNDGFNEEIFELIKMGARGFLPRTASYEDLQTTVLNISKNGYHLTENISECLIKNIQESNTSFSQVNPLSKLTAKEINFIRHASTQKTYKEIAAQLGLSTRTIDSYRDSLFLKLELKSRIGLVLFAFKHGLLDE